MSEDKVLTDDDYRVIFRNSHLLAIQAKEAQDDNEPIAPMCVMGFKNIIVPALMLGVGPGQLNEACRRSVMSVTGEDSEIRKEIEQDTGEPMGPVLWICIHAEAYAEQRDRPAGDYSSRPPSQVEVLPDEDYLPGDMAARFAAGDPAVFESLNTIGMFPGGQHHISHKFRWSIVDGYEWENPEEYDEPGDDRWTYISMSEDQEAL